MDLLPLSIVSKLMNRLGNDNQLWEILCNKLWLGKQNSEALSLYPKTVKEHYKRSYYLSIKDSKREIITMEELCNCKWEFHFRQGRFWNVPEGITIATFTSQYRCNPAVGIDQPWCFLDKKFPDGKKVKKRQLQINQFPPYSIHRTDDWGWRLVSQWAIYLSKRPDELETPTANFGIGDPVPNNIFIEENDTDNENEQ